VNANEVAPRAKIAKVKRDDSGKITGLAVNSVIEPE
jgi:hypothetical protein